MAFAKITSSGLITTALLVACLWGCVFAEARTMRSANRNLKANLVHLRQMRNGKQLIPASRPVKPGSTRRAVAG